MRSVFNACSLLGPLAAACGAVGQTCTPRWLPTFSTVELSGGLDSVLVVNAPDGAAPTIYAGGHITGAGGLPASGIARWDGSTWSPLGPAPGFGQSPGVNSGGYVLAMTVFDDDGPGPHPAALYIGGNFLSAGGVPAACVARWDGVQWSSVGGGISSQISAMAVYDEDGPGPMLPALFVAGVIDHAGGVAVANIARWDGSHWSGVGGGLSNASPNDVKALFVFDEDGPGPGAPCLFAAGRFEQAGNIAASGVARWDGTSWSAMGGGLSQPQALCAFDPDGDGPSLARLVACTDFNGSGQVEMWDGSSWNQLGGLFNAGALTISAYDEDGAGPGTPHLYTSGNFARNGSITLHGIARWNGSDWEDPGAGIPAGAMVPMDPDGAGPREPVLLVGGLTLGIYDGQRWSPLGQGINGTVRALAGARVGSAQERDLYASGTFSYAGGAAASNIAQWDGAAWNGLGSGISNGQAPSVVYAIAEFDPDGSGPLPAVLVAGGSFTSAGGQAVSNIARWDGTQWAAMGNGLDAPVHALLSFDPDGDGPQPPSLFAGGNFQNSGFVPVRYLGKWTGTAWQGVTGPTGPVTALASFDDDGAGPNAPVMLVATPDPQGSALKRFDGTNWSVLGTGLNAPITSILPLDPDGSGPLSPRIYIAGGFTMVNGVLARGAAVLTGSQWSTVGLGFNANLDAPAEALAAFDPSGGGPTTTQLYWGGSFRTAGTVPVSAIAQFDGADWHDMDGGVAGTFQPTVHSLSVFQGAGSPQPSLIVAGDFLSSGGVSAGRIARWACPPLATCYANCDQSTVPPVLNVNDFLCFINRFAAADPYANCDQSTMPPVLNVNDFLCFTNRFAAGCS